MSIEQCLICDRCGSIIAAARTATQARKDARMLYQRRNNRDICTTCEPLSHNKRNYAAEKAAST